VSGGIKPFMVRVLPPGVRRWVRARQRQFGIHWPPEGRVRFGDLRRTTPISAVFGLDRGVHISRYYIEKFLQENAACVQGRVLEFGDPSYTIRFGGSRVTRSDVLGIVAGPQVTIVADLTDAANLESCVYDCIICTQTLQMVYDFRAALRTLERILKPGGVLLLTTHGTSQIGRFVGVDAWGEYWHFTSQSVSRLLAEFFPAENVRLAVYGNVLAAVAHLHGLTAGDVTAEELDERDPAYEVIVAAVARKALCS
jgi:SAM-dependent methyltransferase